MKIGIFTAMQKEAASFLSNGATKKVVGGFDVYSFKLCNHDAVLCCPPTVGEIAAAAACQLLISHFKVDLILNFGVVGALTEHTAAFNTVLVSSVVHYDMDTSAIDGLPVGRYACFDDVAVQCDAMLLNAALKVQKMPMARCASADKFVSDDGAKSLLNRNFGAEICDMESAGILFTCKMNNVPCLLVKCVADTLFGGSGEYAANAARAASGFFALAEKIVSVLTGETV